MFLFKINVKYLLKLLCIQRNGEQLTEEKNSRVEKIFYTKRDTIKGSPTLFIFHLTNKYRYSRIK